MVRFASRFVFSLLVFHGIATAIPTEWQASDYNRGGNQWYAVKVADLPKGSPLAASMERGLINAGWGPTAIEERNDNTLLLVGKTNSIGDAFYLRDELKARKVADGAVVAIPTPVDNKALIQGDFAGAFIPAPEFVPRSARSEEELWARVENVITSLPEEQRKNATDALALWKKKDFSNPLLATGMLPIAAMVWEQRVDPDVAAFIAGRIAPQDMPGRWVTTIDQSKLRDDARVLEFELLDSYYKDWRGAWGALRALSVSGNPKGMSVSELKIRQALLLVDLIRSGEQPAPGYSDVRSLLRASWDASEDSDSRRHARIESFYMLTFAWEGNWPRVERLTNGLKARYPERRYVTALAKTYHAVSRTRIRAYDDALAELDEVIYGSDIPAAELPRRGMEVANPIELAKWWRDTLRVRGEEAKVLAATGYKPAPISAVTSPGAVSVPVPVATLRPVTTEPSKSTPATPSAESAN